MKTILKSDSLFKTTPEILENNYPQILNEIQNEDYIIQYDNYDAFCEIEYGNEVVGFYTLEQLEDATLLNEFYIIGDFRGKNITFDMILDFIAIPNTDFYLYDLFEKAYDEFKLKELKHNKDKIFDTFMEICEGGFLDYFKAMQKNI